MDDKQFTDFVATYNKGIYPGATKVTLSIRSEEKRTDEEVFSKLEELLDGCKINVQNDNYLSRMRHWKRPVRFMQYDITPEYADHVYSVTGTLYCGPMNAKRLLARKFTIKNFPKEYTG